MKRDDMITLTVAHEKTGIPVRTLRHAAMKGKLTARLVKTPLGDYYETTLEDIERWQSSPRMGRPRKQTT